jgi:Mce-associated membrane protein
VTGPASTSPDVDRQQDLADDAAGTREPTSKDITPAPARDRTRLALIAGAAALLLLLAGAIVLGLQLRSAAQDDAVRDDALQAARSSALNLTSIDKDDFEQDVASVLDGATGEFRTDFAARSNDLERLLTENEVVAEGRVLDAGIVRADKTSATALVVVDSTVRNTQTPDGRVNSYRMKLELEKVGDRWLTSVLEFVG